MSNAVTKAEVLEPGRDVVRPASVMTPMEMLDRAVAQGAGIEVLERLMALEERWSRNQARKAFDAAISAAKAEIPVIAKNREVDFTSSKGRTHYRYEDLGEIARTVGPILSRHGLSYRFRTDSPVNAPVSVTCIISHRDGHAEENTLSAARDDSGNKNSIQAIGSALTYLQRMTLKAALGLATSEDDDGKAAAEGEAVSAEQIEKLRQLIDAFDVEDARFCKHMKVDRLEDLPASRFQAAMDALNAYGAKQRAAGR